MLGWSCLKNKFLLSLCNKKIKKKDPILQDRVKTGEYRILSSELITEYQLHMKFYQEIDLSYCKSEL